MSKRVIVSNLLILASLVLLVVIYFAPIWWVSLTAPNYPPESFPDGVRIHFHMNGVFNGCKKVAKKEIEEEEALDCVHEMDTINHYVGMYPIASGGVVEKAFSPFLLSLLGVMLIGFACTKPKIRLVLMAVGFGIIILWMSLYWFGKDGLKYQPAGYIQALVTSLGQDRGGDTGNRAAQAVIERIRESVGDEAVDIEEVKKKVQDEKAKELLEIASSLAQGDVEEGKETAVKNKKLANIQLLKEAFEADQAKKPADQREEWTGSGQQVLRWHYEKSLGRYFNNPAEIEPMVRKMTLAANIVFWAVIAAMLLLLWGARKTGGLIYWLMIVVPMLLPVFFVIEYSAWLWWYGHNLNSMGAFTVKPFMPTVFGDGKVAQFTTHSYPYWGFFLMLLFSALLAVAALLRLKEFKEKGEE